MAKLSNINGKFAVEDTGAIRFSDQTGTTGQILKSNGNSAPTWVDPNTVGTGPWLPLAGGIVSGATTFQSSLTVGGVLTGASATFAGNVKIGSSTTGTPALNADDLVIDKGASESGITLISTAAASIRFGDAANTSIGLVEYNHNSNYMRFSTNNAERMRIESTGVVKFPNTATSTGDVGTIAHYTNNYMYIRGGTSGLAIGDDGFDVSVYLNNSDSIQFNTGGTEKMRITSGARINMDVMAGQASEGVIRIGRYDVNTSRYNEIQNSVTSNGTGSYMNLCVHSGTENVVTDVMTLLGSGNVGIGVTTPGARLELDNPSAFTNMIEYGNVAWNQSTGHGLVAVNRGSDGYVQLQITSGVDNADVFTIRNSGTGANIQHNFLSNGGAYHAGNVGIGTDSPGAKLHNYSTAISNVFISGYGTSAQNNWMGGHAFFVHAENGIIVGKANASNDTNRLYTFYNDAQGNAEQYIYNTSNTATIKLDSAGDSYFNGGNVGIGATSPDFALDIEAVSSGVQLQMGRTTTSAGSTWMGSDSNGFHLGVGAYGAGNSVSDPNGFTVLTSGNVGIGTTSPTGKLMISDANNRTFADAQFKIEGAGYTAVHYLDGTEYMIQQNSGSRRIRMMSGTTNGVLLNPGATAWASASDESLKENIKPLENVLDKIKDYRCVEYNFKSDKLKDKKIGFIAQDWENDFAPIVNKDEEGLLGMKYTETIPVLLKAIQELEARIKILENK